MPKSISHIKHTINFRPISNRNWQNYKNLPMIQGLEEVVSRINIDPEAAPPNRNLTESMALICSREMELDSIRMLLYPTSHFLSGSKMGRNCRCRIIIKSLQMVICCKKWAIRLLMGFSFQITERFLKTRTISIIKISKFPGIRARNRSM